MFVPMKLYLACLGTARDDLFHVVYLLQVSFYFVNTVFSTIGFGDIHATNNAERVYCVLLFYVGVLVFGSLLVELQDILRKAFEMERERASEVSGMIEFLRREKVPRPLEAQLVSWMHWNMKTQQEFARRRQYIAVAPPHLQRQLTVAFHRGILAKVPLLDKLQCFQREDLLLDLFMHMTPRLFGSLTPVAAFGVGHQELFVVSSGTVVVQAHPCRSVVTTIKAGECFGENWLLGVDIVPDYLTIHLDLDNSVNCSFDSAVSLRYVAMTDVECMVLTKVCRLHGETSSCTHTSFITAETCSWCDPGDDACL